MADTGVCLTQLMWTVPMNFNPAKGAYYCECYCHRGYAGMQLRVGMGIAQQS